MTAKNTKTAAEKKKNKSKKTVAAKNKKTLREKSRFVDLVASTLENPKVWAFLVKSTLGALFFIVAFNTSNTKFFEENPIFGVRYLAEILIGLAFAAFGFHTVPIIAVMVKEWFEKFISSTVERIVTDFWNEQTKRMSDARRDRDRKKKAEREKKNKEMLKSSVVVDTSVMVDGRLIDIAKTGFIDFDLVIPSSVLDELHLISDSSDDLKRQRGRRGLDMVNSLKKIKEVTVRSFKAEGDISKDVGVDKELIRLAKKYKMKIMTLDFNLNKVAKAEGVDVLNVNELVNAVKTNVLPGEKMKVKIVQLGKEEGQGVGYLDDGTMIVVEGAAKKKGKKITATVTRIIQTDAGKMIFCEL